MHLAFLAEFEIVTGHGIVPVAVEIARIFRNNGGIGVLPSFSANVFTTKNDLPIVVLSAGSPTVADAVVCFVFVIFTIVIRPAKCQSFYPRMNVQAAYDILAVVVVLLIGAVAIEQSEAIIDEVEFCPS